jgi:hypothetical protein
MHIAAEGAVLACSPFWHAAHILPAPKAWPLLVVTAAGGDRPGTSTLPGKDSDAAALPYRPSGLL